MDLTKQYAHLELFISNCKIEEHSLSLEIERLKSRLLERQNIRAKLENAVDAQVEADADRELEEQAQHKPE